MNIDEVIAELRRLRDEYQAEADEPGAEWYRQGKYNSLAKTANVALQALKTIKIEEG